MEKNNLPIVTERLVIRQLTKDDFEHIYRLCSQSASGDWFPRWNMDREQAAGFLDWQLAKYEMFDVKADIVPLAIELKSNSEFIGHCVIGKHDELDETEIAYGIAKEHRLNGFATEVAIALTKWSFETFDIPYLIGTVKCDNVASIKVLEKAGYEFQRNMTLYYGGEGTKFGYFRYRRK